MTIPKMLSLKLNEQSVEMVLLELKEHTLKIFMVLLYLEQILHTCLVTSSKNTFTRKTGISWHKAFSDCRNCIISYYVKFRPPMKCPDPVFQWCCKFSLWARLIKEPILEVKEHLKVICARPAKVSYYDIFLEPRAGYRKCQVREIGLHELMWRQTTDPNGSFSFLLSPSLHFPLPLLPFFSIPCFNVSDRNTVNEKVLHFRYFSHNTVLVEIIFEQNYYNCSGVSLSLDVFAGCLWDQKVSPD